MLRPSGPQVIDEVETALKGWEANGRWTEQGIIQQVRVLKC